MTADSQEPDQQGGGIDSHPDSDGAGDGGGEKNFSKLDQFDTAPELSIGDEVKVLLESGEDEDGLAALSKRKADRQHLYSPWGFSPFAIALIFIGIIFKLIQIDQFGLVALEHGGDLGARAYNNIRYYEKSYWVISSIANWSLFVGIGYYIFKVFLIGVRQAAAAVKKGLE